MQQPLTPPSEALIDDRDVAFLIEVDEPVNATWHFTDPQPTGEARRGFLMAWHATPENIPTNFTMWYLDAGGYPVVHVSAGGDSVEAGDRSVVTEGIGFRWSFEATYTLQPGLNALVFAARGLASTVSVEYDGTSSITGASSVAGDFATFLSTRNPGDFDDHTEVTVGPNVILDASITLPVEHSSSYVRARLFGDKGELVITGPTGETCTARDLLLPTPMRAAMWGYGPGAYEVSGFNVAPPVLAGNELAVTVVDLPFWPTSDAPECIGVTEA